MKSKRSFKKEKDVIIFYLGKKCPRVENLDYQQQKVLKLDISLFM